MNKAPKDTPVLEKEVQMMLDRFGSDPARPTDIDIARFSKEFERVRQDRAILAGRFTVNISKEMDTKPSNPLIPGSSANQTKSGIGGAQMIPRGY